MKRGLAAALLLLAFGSSFAWGQVTQQTPPATTDVMGKVKPGSGCSITTPGVLDCAGTVGMNITASNATQPTAPQNLVPGLFRAGTLSPGKGWGFNDDLLILQSTDPSLITYITPTGTPTAGETPGVTWHINGADYTVTYTIQAGDTTNALVGIGLAKCFRGTPGANCNISPSSITTALAAIGSQISQNNVTQPAGDPTTGYFAIDVPWSTGATTCPVAASSANTTITVTGCSVLDNAPPLMLQRNVTGRTPVLNDQLGCVYFNGQSAANSGLDTQYGQICTFVGTPDPDNPTGTLNFGVVGSGGKMAQTTFSMDYRGILMGQDRFYTWKNRSSLGSSADGTIELTNNAGTDFGRLNLGGTTASFPAIKREGANVRFRLADDSADAIFEGQSSILATNGVYTWSTRSSLGSNADGKIFLSNNAGSSFTSLALGPETASFPLLKRNGTAINFRLGDDSDDAAATAATAPAGTNTTQVATTAFVEAELKFVRASVGARMGGM